MEARAPKRQKTQQSTDAKETVEEKKPPSEQNVLPKKVDPQELYNSNPCDYFADFKLKTIVKENHGKPITQIAFNYAQENCQNVFATVGDSQANIYDNEHTKGKYLDLFLHFINKPTPFTKKNVSLTVLTCAWMRDSGSESELRGDAYLAIAGEDFLIHIISIKRTKVITVLKGHTSTVTDVVAHPTQHNWLVSTSRDSTVRLWDIHAKTAANACIHKWDIPATVAGFSLDGSKLLIGGPQGSINICEISPKSRTEAEISSLKPFKLQDKKHNGHIDCVRFLDENRIITKSFDGRIFIWEAATGKVLVDIRVPGSDRDIPSRFDISRDNRFLCVGNGEGSVYIYQIEDGKNVAQLEHKRARTPIRCCAFSHDVRSVIFTCSNSNLWRFDWVDPALQTAENAH